MVGNREGNENQAVLLGAGEAVVLYLPGAKHLSLCEHEGEGSPPDPGSALLRPTKNHSET